MARKLTQKEKDLITLALKLESKDKTAPFVHLLDLVHQLQEIAKGDKGEPGKDGEDGLAGSDGFDGAPGKNGKDGKDGKNGVDGKNGIDGRDGIDGKNGSPDEGSQIRNKLEALSGNERLSISAINNLREELDALKKSKGGTTYISGGTAGGNVVRAYDLSDSLDGVTRTFALPAFWRVISVHLSSFPNILRPTADYTTNGSTMQITFTSEIPDNSLSAGQTCIITYATTV